MQVRESRAVAGTGQPCSLDLPDLGLGISLIATLASEFNEAKGRKAASNR